MFVLWLFSLIWSLRDERKEPCKKKLNKKYMYMYNGINVPIPV